MSEDFYEILGVSRDASEDEIKQAYQEKVSKYDPNGTDEPDADKKVKKIKQAKEILTDEEKRQAYDQMGHDEFEDEKDGDLQNVLDQFFGSSDESGRPRQGQNLRTSMAIDLEEAYYGVTKEFVITRPEQCATCEGEGHPLDATGNTCSQCEGSGEVQQTKETPFGRVQQQSTCRRCNGEGEIVDQTCGTCGGDGIDHNEVTLTVEVPAGVEGGQTLRMDGEGAPSENGGPPGDLLIDIEVKDHEDFERDGADLYREVDLSPGQMKSGEKIEIEGVEDTIPMRVPSDTNAETVVKLEGHGMPELRGDGRGNLYVRTRKSGDDTGQPDRVGPPDTIPDVPIDSIAYDALSMGEHIGGGGHATVKRATVTKPEAEIPLAVKQPQIDGTVSLEIDERFLEEARKWDKLDDHNHVVSVVDYGDNPVPWIAMEYMDSGHLGGCAGMVPTDQAVWIAHAVATALHHAHRRSIAHLDLKPENILLKSVEGAWNVPKVADWGLSKELVDRSGRAGGRSPSYAAPEQFDDAYGPTDDLTDIYQLGAVCFELFTGESPFDKTTPLSDRVNMPPPDPRTVADVPDDVADIIMTAMAPDRSDRYDSVVYIRDGFQEVY